MEDGAHDEQWLKKSNMVGSRPLLLSRVNCRRKTALPNMLHWYLKANRDKMHSLVRSILGLRSSSIHYRLLPRLILPKARMLQYVLDLRVILLEMLTSHVVHNRKSQSRWVISCCRDFISQYERNPVSNRRPSGGWERYHDIECRIGKQRCARYGYRQRVSDRSRRWLKWP